VWSFLVFVPCPLLYEIAYPLVLLHLGIALSYRRGWVALRVAAPFLALGALFVLLSLYGRMTGDGVVPGYGVTGSAWGTLRTFLIQLFAPIPGSTLMLRAEYANFMGLGGSPTPAEVLAGAWRGAVVAGVVLGVGGWTAARGGARLPAPGVLWRLAVVGGLLWTTSVMVLATAPKYQMELVPGKGHLSTIFQIFGWSLVVVAALFGLIRAALRRSTFAAGLVVAGAALLLGLGAGVDGYNNMRVTALEVPITKARGLLESAAADGAFASVPDGGSIVFTPRDLGWLTGNFAQNPGPLQALLFDRTGRRYDSRPTTINTKFDCRVVTEAPDCLAPVGAEAAWARVRLHRGGGSVIVGRFEGGHPRGVDRAVTRDISVYARVDGDEVPRMPHLIGVDRRGRPWSSDSLVWDRRAQGSGWAIYRAAVQGDHAPIASGLDDAIAKVDFVNSGPPEQIIRVYGTKSLLP
jgi:hypothetical protein